MSLLLGAPSKFDWRFDPNCTEKSMTESLVVNQDKIGFGGIIYLNYRDQGSFSKHGFQVERFSNRVIEGYIIVFDN